MTKLLDRTIPFAARGALLPILVDLEPETPIYDPKQQLALLADGTPWHTTPQAASCTDTNQDGKGDDVSDPYRAAAS